MVTTPTFSASEVNLLIYHHLKESGLTHSCFALRNECRLDDEPLSHEAVVEPGRLVSLLEKALFYSSVEAHFNEDGTEEPCTAPFRLIGPSHVCDGSSSEGKDVSMSEDAKTSTRLTPSPEPAAAPKLVETAVQTNAERRSASREPSAQPALTDPVEGAGRTNGRRKSTDNLSSKIASSSKTKLDSVAEELTPRETKRRGDVKASKTDKRPRRGSTPKVNGRASVAVGSDEEIEAAEPAEEAAPASPPSPAPSNKKKRRGGTTAKLTASSGNGSTKSEKSAASAVYPPLTGKAKGKQISDKDILRLKGHTAEVFVSAWNPAVPGLLASGAGDATVRIWDMSSAINEDGSLGDLDAVVPTVCKHLPATHAKDVSALSWNPDGTLLASGSYDGILRLWTPQGDLHLVMSMHQGPIFAVRWNRKGNLILSGSADGTAIVWDLSSGKTRQQFSLHSDSVLDVEWLTASMSEGSFANGAPPASADGTIASCSADNSINILRLGENRPVKTLKGHSDEVNAVRFDPTGTYLVSVSDDATARIWNLEAILGSGYLGAASSLSSHLAAPVNGSSSNGVTGKRGSTTPRPARGGSADNMDMDEETSFSADRSSDSIHNPIEGQNGQASNSKQLCRFVLSGHKKDIFGVNWAPQSATASGPRLVATASFDNTARIWNADDGSCLRVFQEHTDSVYGVCFSADRRFIVTGGMDRRLLISSVETGDVVQAHACAGGIFDVTWHAAGRARNAIKGNSSVASSDKAAVKSEEDASVAGAAAGDTTQSTTSSSLSSAPNMSGNSHEGAKSGKQYLALSQGDKMLTVLDVSNL